MFSNIIFYRLTGGLLDHTVSSIEASLESAQFVACGPSQEKSCGWVPPRGEAHGALVELVACQLILKLQTETKAVPGDVVSRRTAERCAQIEVDTGRKPGKKETREIKDDIKLELLPMAFSKLSSNLVWIDVENSLLVIESGSQNQADAVVTQLVRSIEGLGLRLVDTKVSPTAAMSEWLITQESPSGFTVDRECELKAADESKATIKYGNHPLDTDEVKHCVEQGKLPTKLALTWDSRVSFVLTEGLQVKKLAFLDVVFEDRGLAEPGSHAFDADVAIATGELKKLIPDLLAILGGEITPVAEA